MIIYNDNVGIFKKSLVKSLKFVQKYSKIDKRQWYKTDTRGRTIIAYDKQIKNLTEYKEAFYVYP